MVLKELVLKRVIYGSDKTPLELREYYLKPGMPVGCVGELKTFYKGKVKKLILMDKTGKIKEQEVIL